MSGLILLLAMSGTGLDDGCGAPQRASCEVKQESCDSCRHHQSCCRRGILRRLFSRRCRPTVCCETAVADPGNWFVHRIGDPENPQDDQKWTFAIDHSFVAGDLPAYVKQCSLKQSPGGGYPRIEDAAEAAICLFKTLGGCSPTKGGSCRGMESRSVERISFALLPPWYVHRTGSSPADYRYLIDHVYSSTVTSTRKHCPTDGAGTPIFPGYPFNSFDRAADAMNCMQREACPPCLR